MKKVHPIALFRLTVLGPLACREKFKRGEISQTIQSLSEKPLDIPGSKNTFISKKTIESWYYLWRQGGIDALAPKSRCDQGQSKLSPALQEKIIALKKENDKRSISTIKQILEDKGDAEKDELSRSSIHRLLFQHGLSRPSKEETTIERRSYEALNAGDLWVGDVMHGPTLKIGGKERKVYLVSLMDDASRLLPHSAFCLGETALDIEGVLKQAVLKRGLCTKLVVDNGSAYRAETFQAVCARLDIRLIFCRAYDPQSKGKLERFHRLFRAQFLSELHAKNITQLTDLNIRLWAWINQVYHTRKHGALDNLSPLERYQQDLVHIRQLRLSAEQYDKIFFHHLERTVRKDATISYEGTRYEVPFSHSDDKVILVADPHQKLPMYVETLDGKYIGPVAKLDYHANAKRRRYRPKHDEASTPNPTTKYSTVEQALKKQTQSLTSKKKQ
jgi:putative transposase